MGESQMAKIVAVANQKGGVGKTTSAVSLAAALAKKKKKVLLLDSDPQGNGSSGLGIRVRELKRHLYHSYTGGVPLADIMVTTDVPYLSVIPASIDLAAAEVELVGVDQRERCLERLLAPVVDQFDFILIDCPPSLGLLTVNSHAV
jgi:chromosome partitioning protein